MFLEFRSMQEKLEKKQYLDKVKKNEAGIRIDAFSTFCATKLFTAQ